MATLMGGSAGLMVTTALAEGNRPLVVGGIAVGAITSKLVGDRVDDRLALRSPQRDIY